MTKASLVPSALLVREREAAAMLGISPRKLWGLTSPRGPIKCVRIGRGVRYSVAWLEEWVAAAVAGQENE